MVLSDTNVRPPGALGVGQWVTVPMNPSEHGCARSPRRIAVSRPTNTRASSGQPAGTDRLATAPQQLSTGGVRPRRKVPRRSEDRHLRTGVVVTLFDAIALRDPQTARHAAAVAHHARALAERAGCSEQEQRTVHTAGLLHDIGKFGLSDAALGGAELSQEDWQVVRRLPQESAALIGRLEGYGPAAEVVLYHHERVDGTGYPTGLIAHEIPLLSRILAVANVYDAITALNSWRRPVSQTECVQELRRAAGAQLDTDLVETFVALLAERPADEIDFEAELEVERRAWSIDAA